MPPPLLVSDSVPGPAMLRIRRDVADRLELPGASEAPAATTESTTLDRASRGDCSPLPVRAFVLLRLAYSGIELVRVSATDALRELWSLSFRLPNLEDRARCFQGVTALADAIPVWNLYRPFRLDLLGDVVQKIVADA